MTRGRRWGLVAGLLIGVALGGVWFGQSVIDAQVEALLAPASTSVERSWGKLVSTQLATPRERSASAAATLAVVESRFLRRSCAGDWVVGLGARVHVKDVALRARLSSHHEVALGAEEMCFDITLTDPTGVQRLQLHQGAPIAFSGICGPLISNLQIDWEPHRRIDGTVSIADQSLCLKKLAVLAPQYPNGLVPQAATIIFHSQEVDWERRDLKGKSPVALVAELSTRLQKADVMARLSFETTSGEEVSACFKKNTQADTSDYQIELGLSETALTALTAPFLSEDNRAVLTDLRTDSATCDGAGNGLSFSSDLSEVRLRKMPVERLSREAGRVAGLRTEMCASPPEGAKCSYEFAVVQFGEDGRLTNPAQVDAIVDSLKDSTTPVQLTAFVHGWRHSARPGDGNLYEFERLVEKLAVEVASSDQEQTRVIGVYLSWPGQLYESKSANKLATFWNRLEVARQLGAPESELEGTLKKIAKKARRTGSKSGRGFMVSMAHSMGADALLSAATRGAEKRPLGDLIIAINPAVSVARYEKMREALAKAETPIVIYGSESDRVNQQLYPLGEALTFKGPTREELLKHTTTITNEPSLVRAHLGRLPRVVLGQEGEMTFCHHSARAPEQGSCHPIDPQVAELKEPLIVTVDEGIIPSHAEFFTAPFVAHLLSVISTPPNPH